MKSYLSQDLYTFTMKQAVWSLHPNAIVEYEFFCRNKDINLLPYAEKIKQRIDDLNGLGPTESEINYLRSLGYFNPAFLDELSYFKIHSSYATVYDRDGQLGIRVRAPWYQGIDFEVPVLRIVNETYFEQYDTPAVRKNGDWRLTEKIAMLLDIREEEEHLTRQGVKFNPFRLMEFGTRRAFSEEWQYYVFERLAHEAPESMVLGTSNVHCAMVHGSVPQGTMAHQWLMAYQAFAPLHLSQRMALEDWIREWRGKNGLALSDTLGRKQFLKDFDLLLASSYAGARQDSGDEYAWGRDIVKHYRDLNIDPFNKVAAWTNSLNVPKSRQIWREFRSDIRTTFGIGTDFTNDMGIPPLNIVMKMVKCNDVPLIKISDDPGKVTCQNDNLREWALDLCVR